jgi:hypothetical protein
MQEQGEDVREPIRFVEPPLPQATDVLATVTPPGGWLEKLRHALDVGRNLRTHLRPPSDAESVSDLLAVRVALGVADQERQPVRFAAERFAGLVAGGQRNSDLIDWLRAIHSQLNPRVQKAVADGLKWAVLQAAKGAADGN